MDNVSILKIILSQINSVLICSIRVSIKYLHFKRQSWLHNHKLLSLICKSDFLTPPKLDIDNVKSWPSKSFFFVTTSLKSSIKIPIWSFLLEVQPWKKDHYLGWVKKIDWKCSQISTFWLKSKFKHVFLH